MPSERWVLRPHGGCEADSSRSQGYDAAGCSAALRTGETRARLAAPSTTVSDAERQREGESESVHVGEHTPTRVTFDVRSRHGLATYQPSAKRCSPVARALSWVLQDLFR